MLEAGVLGLITPGQLSSNGRQRGLQTIRTQRGQRRDRKGGKEGHGLARGGRDDK